MNDTGLLEAVRVIQGRQKSFPGFAYPIAVGQFGRDVVVPEAIVADENRMSIWIPFADGNDRDGVGDVLEVGGIRTNRHKVNPFVLYDHGKQVSLPVGISEDPDTRAYTVEINPEGRRAKGHAFFYQGTGLSGVDRSAEYDHGHFCHQLYDLMVKGFVRGGSIGYTVVAARELPPDYERGTPKGLHLMAVNMLEYSAVVLPANQDTVIAKHKGLEWYMGRMADQARQILCMKSVCGKPLPGHFIKSLSAYAQAVPSKVKMALDPNTKIGDRVTVQPSGGEASRLTRVLGHVADGDGARIMTGAEAAQRYRHEGTLESTDVIEPHGIQMARVRRADEPAIVRDVNTHHNDIRKVPKKAMDDLQTGDTARYRPVEGDRDLLEGSPNYDPKTQLMQGRVRSVNREANRAHVEDGTPSPAGGSHTIRVDGRSTDVRKVPPQKSQTGKAKGDRIDVYDDRVIDRGRGGVVTSGAETPEVAMDLAQNAVQQRLASEARYYGEGAGNAPRPNAGRAFNNQDVGKDGSAQIVDRRTQKTIAPTDPSMGLAYEAGVDAREFADTASPEQLQEYDDLVSRVPGGNGMDQSYRDTYRDQRRMNQQRPASDQRTQKAQSRRDPLEGYGRNQPSEPWTNGAHEHGHLIEGADPHDPQSYLQYNEDADEFVDVNYVDSATSDDMQPPAVMQGDEPAPRDLLNDARRVRDVVDPRSFPQKSQGPQSKMAVDPRVKPGSRVTVRPTEEAAQAMVDQGNANVTDSGPKTVRDRMTRRGEMVGNAGPRAQVRMDHPNGPVTLDVDPEMADITPEKGLRAKYRGKSVGAKAPMCKDCGSLQCVCGAKALSSNPVYSPAEKEVIGHLGLDDQPEHAPETDAEARTRTTNQRYGTQNLAHTHQGLADRERLMANHQARSQTSSQAAQTNAGRQKGTPRERRVYGGTMKPFDRLMLDNERNAQRREQESASEQARNVAHEAALQQQGSQQKSTRKEVLDSWQDPDTSVSEINQEAGELRVTGQDLNESNSRGRELFLAREYDRDAGPNSYEDAAAEYARLRRESGHRNTGEKELRNKYRRGGVKMALHPDVGVGDRVRVNMTPEHRHNLTSQNRRVIEAPGGGSRLPREEVGELDQIGESHVVVNTDTPSGEVRPEGYSRRNYDIRAEKALGDETLAIRELTKSVALLVKGMVYPRNGGKPYEVSVPPDADESPEAPVQAANHRPQAGDRVFNYIRGAGEIVQPGATVSSMESNEGYTTTHANSALRDLKNDVVYDGPYQQETEQVTGAQHHGMKAKAPRRKAGEHSLKSVIAQQGDHLALLAKALEIFTKAIRKEILDVRTSTAPDAANDGAVYVDQDGDVTSEGIVRSMQVSDHLNAESDYADSGYRAWQLRQASRDGTQPPPPRVPDAAQEAAQARRDSGHRNMGEKKLRDKSGDPGSSGNQGHVMNPAWIYEIDKTPQGYEGTSYRPDVGEPTIRFDEGTVDTHEGALARHDEVVDESGNMEHLGYNPTVHLIDRSKPTRKQLYARKKALCAILIDQRSLLSGLASLAGLMAVATKSLEKGNRIVHIDRSRHGRDRYGKPTFRDYPGNDVTVTDEHGEATDESAFGTTGDPNTSTPEWIADETRRGLYGRGHDVVSIRDHRELPEGSDIYEKGQKGRLGDAARAVGRAAGTAAGAVGQAAATAGRIALQIPQDVVDAVRDPEEFGGSVTNVMLGHRTNAGHTQTNIDREMDARSSGKGVKMAFDPNVKPGDRVRVRPTVAEAQEMFEDEEEYETPKGKVRSPQLMRDEDTYHGTVRSIYDHTDAQGGMHRGGVIPDDAVNHRSRVFGDIQDVDPAPRQEKATPRERRTYGGTNPQIGRDRRAGGLTNDTTNSQGRATRIEQDIREEQARHAQEMQEMERRMQVRAAQSTAVLGSLQPDKGLGDTVTGGKRLRAKMALNPNVKPGDRVRVRPNHRTAEDIANDEGVVYLDNNEPPRMQTGAEATEINTVQGRYLGSSPQGTWHNVRDDYGDYDGIDFPDHDYDVDPAKGLKRKMAVDPNIRVGDRVRSRPTRDNAEAMSHGSDEHPLDYMNRQTVHGTAAEVGTTLGGSPNEQPYVRISRDGEQDHFAFDHYDDVAKVPGKGLKRKMALDPNVKPGDRVRVRPTLQEAQDRMELPENYPTPKGKERTPAILRDNQTRYGHVRDIEHEHGVEQPIVTYDPEEGGIDRYTSGEIEDIDPAPRKGLKRKMALHPDVDYGDRVRIRPTVEQAAGMAANEANPTPKGKERTPQVMRDENVRYGHVRDIYNYGDGEPTLQYVREDDDKVDYVHGDNADIDPAPRRKSVARKRYSLKNSQPGTSLIWVARKDLQPAMAEAVNLGLKAVTHGGDEKTVRLKVTGEDAVIDRLAKKYGRPINLRGR